MRRFLIILIQALLMAACQSGSQEEQTIDNEDIPVDSAALKVAVMPTLDCLPLFVAADRGYFEQEAVTVGLCPYMAQMDCDTAFANGHVDGMMTDLVRTERLKQKGMAIRYVSSTELFWQLLSGRNARIKQLKQLDDKMLAMTRYSATALLADMLVERAGLEPERVFRIQVNNVGIRLSMLENNIMDALLLPEPQATAARGMNSTLLYDSRQDSIQLGVLAFSEKALADSVRQHQLEAFLRAYAMACDSLNERGLAAYKDVVTAHCKVTPETADSLPNDLFFRPVAPPRQIDVDRAKNWLKKK